MRTWTELENCRYEELVPFCRGTYQRQLLAGNENLSGSTIRGSAHLYSDRYETSRKNVLRRIQDAGYSVSERVSDHNARILVIEKKVR